MKLQGPIKAAFICAFLIAAFGCTRGDGLTRVVVTGKVSFQGNPVEDGQIRYIPIEDTPGPVTISPIQNGEYVCDARGGVPAGKHRVEILVWDPKVPPPKGPGVPARPQWAPAKYNKESELIAEIEPISSSAERDFELQ